MNELFPIVRRKRRPLLVTDTPPVMVGNVEPVMVEANEGCEARSAESKATKQPVRTTDEHG